MPSDWEIVEDDGKDWEIVREDKAIIPEVVSEEESKKLKPLPFGFGGFTEEEWAKHPVQTGIAQTAREISTIPAAHFINQYLGDYPRETLEEFGYEYPEAETPAGKGLSQFAGILGVTTGLLPKIGAVAGGKIAMAAGTPLLKRIGAGAVSGAVTSGLYGQPMEQRPSSIALGTFLGGVGGIGAGIFKNIQKLRQLRQGLKQIKTEVVGKGVNLGAEDLPKSQMPRKIGESIRDMRLKFGKVSEEFDEMIETEALQNAKDIKPKLVSFGGRLSNVYGKKLDEFDEVLTELDIKVAKNDAIDTWLKPALEKVSDDPLATSKLLRFIKDRGYIVEEVISNAGNKSYSITPIDIPKDEYLDFRELVNWKNAFKKTGLSASAKSGMGLKKEDMAYRSLQDSWGEFLSNTFKQFPQENGSLLQQFNEMQSEYAPLAQAKWKAYKIFKPFDPTDINIDKGVRFFKDYAVGKAKAGQDELLRIVEKGSKFSSGVGDISSKIKSLGLKKGNTEKELGNFVEELIKYQIKAKDILAMEKQMVTRRNSLLKLLGYSAGIAVEAGGLVAGAVRTSARGFSE